jgi:hypothetical protein
VSNLNILVSFSVNLFLYDIGKEEHKHIDRIFGNNGKCIKSIEQNLIKQDEKVYDIFVLKMNNGIEKNVFFDITSFYGKM